MTAWFATTFSSLAAAAISAFAIYGCVILFTRLAGVRSFAKMSGFDFAMTIAVGSVIASTALSKSTPLPVGVLVLGILFFLQWLIAKARKNWKTVSRIIDNEPILVMREGEILEGNLKTAAMATDDLWSKLREANVLELEKVRAVIVETTGDVTVLHGDPAVELSPELFSGVRGTGDS
jgi:uncharacterized membrane protein YcaP (DUF421 family)